MRHYLEAPYACMEMRYDDLLASALTLAIQNKMPGVAVETGTYKGTGSTRTVGNVLRDNNFQGIFNTIEANKEIWSTAKVNLADLPFVNCLWGCSVDPDFARDWLNHDEALHNMNKYPNVYIDGFDNVIEGYAQEVAGAFKPSDPSYAGTQLLNALLAAYRDKYPLILLDSAGGIGHLEFEVVQKTMEDRPYLLILDDIEHVKHFRSIEIIRNDPKFTILASREGWALAQYG